MPHTNKNGYSKTCIYTHEQCTAANAQWTRMMDTIITNTKHPGHYKLFKPSVDQNVLNFLRFANEENVSNHVRNQENMNQNQMTNESDDLLSNRGVTPWKDDGKSYSPGLQGLHEEIEDFCNYIQPLPEERNMRCDVIQRLQLIVKSIWPNAEVKVFGSFETGLYLPTSDIDLVVRCSTLDPQTALHVLQQQLNNRGEYDDIKVIKTSVPIVKFTDRRTAVRVDVSFNVSTGIMSAEFIKGMMMAYPELRYLVFVLKQFLLSKQLLESFNGGISSYCLILLIVSYLQLHPEDRVAGNHGDRLIKFLELYGRHFNYLKCGIRVNNGGSYFRKGDSEGDPAKCYSLLCIEDPFNPANDIGQGCYGAMKVRDEFDQAFRELCDAVLPQYRIIQPPGASMLARILLVAPELVTYRRIIRERYMLNISFNQPQPIFHYPPNTFPAYVFPGPIYPDPNIYLAHLPLQISQINSAPHSTTFAEDRSDTDSVGSQTSNLSLANKQQNEMAHLENDSDLSDTFKRLSTSTSSQLQSLPNPPINIPPPSISVNHSLPVQLQPIPVPSSQPPTFHPPIEHFPPMPSPVNHGGFRAVHPGNTQVDGVLPRSSSWHNNNGGARMGYIQNPINHPVRYTRSSGANSPGEGNKMGPGSNRTMPETRRKKLQQQNNVRSVDPGPIKSASLSTHMR